MKEQRRERALPTVMSKLEVTRFLRNRGSQFLFLGNRATRIGGPIPEESQFLFLGNRSTSSSTPTA